MRLSKNNPSKPDEEFEIPSEPVIPPAFTTTPSPITTRASTVSPSVSAPAPASAVIGPKITFKGEIIGEEDLLVQGKVEGSIDLKGNHLMASTPCRYESEPGFGLRMLRECNG